VMKSGGTYVPLEPDYPTARVKMILEDAEVEMVLLDSGSMQTLPMEGIDVLLMDNAATDDQWMSEFPGANIGDSLGDDQPELTPDNLLYILFTSGSTGRPKGVMVPQRGLINYLHHSTSQYLSAAMQGSVVSSPLCFDATLTTLLTPLFGGKTVHLVADNDNTLSLLATQLFDQTQPWLFKITPAHLEALALLAEPGKVCEAGHKIVVGGEQLSYKTLEVYRQQLLPNATFINEYGPTETVVGCSVYTVAPLSEAPEAANRPLSVPIFVPIGRAIGNTRLYVMSQGMQVQPINSIGELYIGGDGVTMGYLNRDDLTEQSYLEHPHIAGERLYRTGDLVRWLADGQLAFVGRVDHQVKIRGFRIELGEIESVLRDHDDVRDAVVVANTDEQDTRLVAYVVPNQYPVNVDDQALKQDEKALAQDKQALGRTYLECAQAMLPQYMVPSLYVVLESLPLTNNGKVDTAALPAPGGEGIQQQEYVAPVTPTECVVCELWQEMLQIEQVGVSDNFFELGGHSLTATRLIAQINQQFGLMLSLQVIFKMQTVAELVVHIDFLVAQNDINRASESGSDDSELEEVEW
jgi:amino acid adenylation domain-containing protein